MRWQWHMGLGPELGNAFWALTFFEATLGSYAPVWPLWIQHLGAPIPVVGVVLAMQGVIRPFVLGPGASLVDRFNTRHVLLVCRVISIIGLLVAAFAGAWWILLLTVTCNAIGELVFPTIHAYVAHHAGDDPVHAFNMTITIGPAAGLIITPFVSGLVIALGGMRSAFFLSTVLCLCALFFVSRMDFAASHTPGSSLEPSTYRSVMQHRGMRQMIVLHAVTIAALGMGVALISNFLESERGIEPSLITILSAGAAIGTVIYGVLSSRIPLLKPNPVLAAGIATAFVAIGFVIFATQHAIPLIALAYVLRGGVFSAWALFLAAMGKIAPMHLRNRGFTIMEILGGSMMSFGPLVAAQLWEIDPRVPFLSAAVLSMGFAIYLIRVHRILASEPLPNPVR